MSIRPTFPATEANVRPEYGSPEWNALYDAGRKELGYPSRAELAEFNRRFPVYGSPEWLAQRGLV